MTMQDLRDLIYGIIWCIGFAVVLFVLPACATIGTSADPCARLTSEPNVLEMCRENNNAV